MYTMIILTFILGRVTDPGSLKKKGGMEIGGRKANWMHGISHSYRSSTERWHNPLNSPPVIYFFTVFAKKKPHCFHTLLFTLHFRTLNTKEKEASCANILKFIIMIFVQNGEIWHSTVSDSQKLNKKLGSRWPLSMYFLN